MKTFPIRTPPIVIKYTIYSKIPQDIYHILWDFTSSVFSYCIDGGHCSNTEFAARVGISPNTISKITSYGIIPNTKSIVKIADYLQVSIPYLLAKTDENSFDPALQPVTFQERLKQLIRENAMRIANVTNNPNATFSRNSIHLWLKRNNLPAIDFVFQLATIFNVSPDYLLGRSDDR